MRKRPLWLVFRDLGTVWNMRYWTVGIGKRWLIVIVRGER